MEVGEYFLALNFLKQTVDQTFDTNDSSADYNRGVLRGLQMSEELAQEFFLIEQANQKKYEPKQEGLKNGIGFANY